MIGKVKNSEVILKLLIKNKTKASPKKRDIRIIRFTIFFVMMFLISSAKAQPVFAAGNPTKADFFVQPFFDNNASPGANYKDHPDTLWYDNVKPGSQIRATILITNQSEQARSFQVSAYTGSTSNSGSLVYNSNRPKMDQSQQVDFRSLFKNNEVYVKVPGKNKNNGQVAVSLTAQIPNTNMKGTVLGGFNVYAYDPTDKQPKKQSSLVNKFRFVIPVVFEVNTSFAQQRANFKDSIKLGNIMPQVTLQGSNNVVSVRADLHNTAAATLGNFRTYAAVTKKGEKKIRATATTEANQIAPNSVWTYPILWGDQAVEAGDYHLTLKIRNDGLAPVKDNTSVAKKYDWKVERDFTITGSQAGQLNRQLGIKPNYLWLWITLAILAVVLLILVVWYFARRTKKDHRG